MEEIIYAQASPHSIAGNSLFSSTGFNENNVSDYYSDKKVVNKAVSKLKKAGFEVHFVAKTSISISGKKSLYEQVFGKKITKESKKVRGSQDEETSIDYYKVGDGTSSFLATDTSPFADVIEGIAIAEEPIYFGSAYAPTKNYFSPNNPFNNNVEKFYQLKFKGKYLNYSIRCMADLIIVDHVNKTVLPCDLKTSFKPEWKFFKSFI